MIFFFKQKTAYEMRISDWSSDVCSSDLPVELEARQALARRRLESLASGDGGVEISESVFERLDLANLAATVGVVGPAQPGFVLRRQFLGIGRQREDRKSTRLNSSTNAHLVCRLLLEKKKQHRTTDDDPNTTRKINYSKKYNTTCTLQT